MQAACVAHDWRNRHLQAALRAEPGRPSSASAVCQRSARFWQRWQRQQQALLLQALPRASPPQSRAGEGFAVSERPRWIAGADPMTRNEAHPIELAALAVTTNSLLILIHLCIVN